MDFNQSPMDQNQKPTQKFWVKWAVISLVALIAVYQVGYTMGHKGYVFVPKEFKVINQADQPQSVDYNLLWDALNTV